VLAYTGTTTTNAAPAAQSAFLAHMTLGTLPASRTGVRLEQTSGGTPGPTVTATPGALPDAQTLISQTDAALLKANTFHLNMTVGLQVAGLLSENITADGDAIAQSQSSMLHITGTAFALGKKAKIDEWTITIAKKAWIKDKKTKNRWKRDKSGGSTTGISPTALTAGNNTQLTDLTNLGADTFNGHPVWHVHGTYRVKLSKGKYTDGTVDYLIEQDTSLPDQTTVAVNDPADGIQMNVSLTLSNYGEQITITKPRVGSTTP
jgi:hypothetical protein